MLGQRWNAPNPGNPASPGSTRASVNRTNRQKSYRNLGLVGVGLLAFCANGLAQKQTQTSTVKSESKPAVAQPKATALAPKIVAPTPAELRRSMYGYFGWGTSYPAIHVDPQMEVLKKVEEPDHFRWHIRYRVDTDEYSYAYLLIPKPFPAAGKRLPLVLCPHPTADIGKDKVIGRYDEPAPNQAEAEKRLARQYALDLVRRGFVAFAPDRAAYGERRPLQEGNYRKQMPAYQDALQKRHPGWRLTAGKNVWDLQRALDFLVKLDFVDPQNIGTIGHSLGAWDSLMILAMDDRVKTGVVNSGGSLAFKPELWENATALRDYLKDPKKQSLNVNSNIFFMLVAGRSLLYLWSIEDTYDRGGGNLVEGFRTIKKSYASTFHAQGPTALSFYLHSRGHDFPSEAHALAYTWLEQKLELQQKLDLEK